MERFNELMAEMITAIQQKVIDIERGVKCKFCASDNVVRFGYTKLGVQQFLCRQCGRKFADNQALPRMRSPLIQQSAALSMYYGGMSLKEVRRHLAQEYGNTSISRSTLDRWVNRYTKIATDEANKYTPKVGDTWIADETVLKINGKNIWCFDLIDSDTRFLLSSHLAHTRTVKDAQILIERAYQKSSKIPKRLITDSLGVYPDAIERVFGADSPKHIQSKPFVEQDSTNQIERWHSTLKFRTEIMRGLKSLKTARNILDGFLVYYNYLRPHDALDDKTPAEVAGINFLYKSWLDVLKSQSYPTQKNYPVSIEVLPKGYMSKLFQEHRKTAYRKKHKPRLRARSNTPEISSSR